MPLYEHSVVATAPRLVVAVDHHPTCRLRGNVPDENYATFDVLALTAESAAQHVVDRYHAQLDLEEPLHVDGGRFGMGHPVAYEVDADRTVREIVPTPY